jgi:purine-nucleoside phosphorylase
MLSAESVTAFQTCVRQLGPKHFPLFHLVLGSGFGEALGSVTPADWPKDWIVRGEFSFRDVAGLVAATAPDHRGKFRLYEHLPTGDSAVFQLGRLHGYEGLSARQAVSAAMVARLAGVENFVLTNAAGGLSSAYRPGDVMLLRDHVNLTGQNPLVGPNPSHDDGRPLGPRFPDLSGLYDAAWRVSLAESLRPRGLRVWEGTYLGLLGPSFETPAEIALFAAWGLHAVGMSTVWEAIALKHAGARIAALSLISNAACGLGDGAPLDHQTILATCRASAAQIVTGLLDWLGKEMKNR